MKKLTPEKVLTPEDFSTVCQMARRYGVEVADLGRIIIRQVRRRKARAIRFTEDEMAYIRRTAAQNKLPVATFIGKACHEYLQLKKRQKPLLLPKKKGDKYLRDERIEARMVNGEDERRLYALARRHSTTISGVIRFCALHFDGEEFIFDEEFYNQQKK